MSSLKPMRWVAATILIGVFASACGTSSTAPSPPPSPPTTHPTVAIASITTNGSRTAGYQYRTVIQLKESNGANATIAAVDLTFMAGTTQLASSHFDRPISDTANVCPASSTISTRELVTTDPDPSHAYAVTVRATVTFGDGTGYTATAAASADVPPSTPVPPQTYSMTGVITDAGTHAGIAGAQVSAINGANVGKSATTDATGTYVIADLVAETFRLRASASGYGSGEQNVTVPGNTRADFQLQSTVQTACAYTVSPSNPTIVSTDGGTFNVSVTRTSGSCSWQAAASANWITFPNGASGGGSGTLQYTVGPNGTFNNRAGTITVSWSGGSAQVAVQQGPHADFECFVSISKGPQDFDNVPPGGGTLTVFASVTAVPAGWPCTGSVSSTVPWIAGGGTITGPSTLTFTVAANPSPGVSRSGSIVGQVDTKTASVSVTQR